MSKQNVEKIEETIGERYKRRDRKNKKIMKISGSSVKSLARIIENKSKNQ